jgi:hypothetical protein
MRHGIAVVATTGGLVVAALAAGPAWAGPHRSNSGSGGGTANGTAAGSSSPGGTAHGSPNGDKSGQPLNLQHAQLGSYGLAGSARAKMAAGDCAAALDLFDEALRSSLDPTLFRDRGTCHERLGHPYPAIDDYRHYLVGAPEAADADSIRERLELLEEKVKGRARASESDDSPFRGEDANGGASAGAGGMQTGANASAEGGGGPSRDKADEDEDELGGALRRGRGWSLAPYFAEHKWFFGGTSFGDNQTWSECIGVQLRYAPNRAGAIFVELGYEHFNSTSDDIAVVYGLTTMVGYEFRFGLDPRYDNQLFLTPGVGYSHFQVAPNDPDLSSTSEGAVTGRLRFGYRRAIGTNTAFEASLDGGAAEFFLFDGSGMSSGTGFASLNLAFAWGL